MPFTIWPSQRIAAALTDGTIIVDREIDKDQIQPASLDLRLGMRAYRLPASFLPGPGRTVADCLKKLATHEVDLSRPTVLERNCVHVIPLMERLKLQKGVNARTNPKSSSGRLDIFVRVIADNGQHFDDIPDGYEGPLYAEVVPRSFPIIAVAGSRLAQIRFRSSLNAPHPAYRTVPVTIDLDPEGKEGGVVGYRARRTSGLVDLARVGALSRTDYWEPIVTQPDRRELILVPDDFYILASAEAVIVGMDEAAEMVAYDTSVGEIRVHYAGYLDPAFGLAEAGGAGSRIVLEVRSHDVPFLIDHGQRIGSLIYEPMTERPDRLYGVDLGSNYQGQGLKLSKHFI